MAQTGKNQTVTSYLGALPEDHRQRGEAIHRLVRKLFPKAKFDFGYRMPTYHVGEQFFAWGNKKHYLSVYTCSAERIAGFLKQHPDIPSSVGCLNFRDRDPFPLRDLATVIKNALAPSSLILNRGRRSRSSANYNLL